MARFVILRWAQDAPPGRRSVVDVVRDGWTWLGFLFPLFWLLWHRLWFAAVMVFAIAVAIALLTQSPVWAAIVLPANLLLGLFVGLEGQGWRIGLG